MNEADPKNMVKTFKTLIFEEDSLLLTCWIFESITTSSKHSELGQTNAPSSSSSSFSIFWMIEISSFS
jgi:hypothetical protein